MQKSYLYIGDSGERGRGVFTRERIPAGTVIEIAPVIVMSAADREHLDKTLLHDYIFEWGKERDQCCMALGLIPIYNHDFRSNCEYFMDYGDSTIMVKTVRKVEQGEELTINYNGDWNNSKSLWFNAR